MYRKRPRDESKELKKHVIKIAAVKASPAVVSIVSHNVPVEMCESFRGYFKISGPPPKEVIFFGCGIIIECQRQKVSAHNNDDIKADATASYLCTILAPSSLFHRGNHHVDIDIDVFVSTGVLHRGKLIACDFHYNLAAITIKSDSPLPTATFKGIDDLLSIDPTHLPHLQSGDNPFQLRPHSPLFKLSPGDQLVSVSRSHVHPLDIEPGNGTFSPTSPKGFSCNELYHIAHDFCLELDGSPVLNSFGEIIGVIFNSSSFLPSNSVLRWWNHYKSSGGFRRPFLGVEVANLHEADVIFLAQFVTKFPNISMAVVVTKVEKDSPACRSGIRTNDVIVKLDSKPVRSKLEFYEKTWLKAGKSVELIVLRVTSGEELNLCSVIEEANPNKLHQWPHPCWGRIE